MRTILKKGQAKDIKRDVGKKKIKKGTDNRKKTSRQQQHPKHNIKNKIMSKIKPTKKPGGEIHYKSLLIVNQRLLATIKQRHGQQLTRHHVPHVVTNTIISLSR